MRAPAAHPNQTPHYPGVTAIESKELARSIAQIIADKQGEDIEILDVSGPLVIADCFVLASARNTRHARAIASEIVYTMKHDGRLCRHNAGMDGESTWVLLDFDDVVVHLLQHDARSFYDLEGLWADVPRIEFTPAPAPEASEGSGQPPLEPLPESAYPDSGTPR